MRQSRHALDEQADVTAGAGRRVGQERRRSGLDPASGDILDLQASAGNGAIAKLLAGGPGATAGTKGAPLRLQRAVTSPPVVQREAGPPLLRVGSVGSEVVDLQAALNSAGVARPPLVTDGQFGGGTRSAVVALQRGAGIAPDGIVGPDTRAALTIHGGQGHGSAEEAELGQRISAAIEGQVGAAGTAAGAPKGVSGELTTGLVSGSGRRPLDPYVTRPRRRTSAGTRTTDNVPARAAGRTRAAGPLSLSP
jgi:peptidoglycan hydrolase-like protein with peptidoglycan-binding domain